MGLRDVIRRSLIFRLLTEPKISSILNQNCSGSFFDGNQNQADIMKEHSNRINHAKVCPAEVNITRQADNPPDVPAVETPGLKKLAKRFPTNINNSLDRLPGFEVKKGKKIADPVRGKVDAVELRPVGKKPLIPFNQISIGGGRPMGGGTSKEALRRAKRKVKRNGNGNGRVNGNAKNNSLSSN